MWEWIIKQILGWAFTKWLQKKWDDWKKRNDE